MLITRVLFLSFFFFFSSRRRHTRSLCDWSSDVCSSDLACPGCGRTTSTVFQELADNIQTYLRDQMPVWKKQRSEEHTSELQSHSDLVCRLLREKKKKKETLSTIICMKQTESMRSHIYE